MRYRDFVTVQKPRTGTGPYNGDSGEYDDYRDRRCKINTISASDFFDAQRENTRVTHKIEFHYENSLLRPNYRLIQSACSPNRIFQIMGVVNVRNENKILLAYCEEII